MLSNVTVVDLPTKATNVYSIDMLTFVPRSQAASISNLEYAYAYFCNNGY